MVKKFSYLVSVSVLAGSLLSSTSHAIYDDELRDVINAFLISQSRVPLPSSSSSDSEPSSFWSSAWAFGSSILSGTGHTFRYLGDTVRGESLAGDILTEKVISIAETTEYKSMSAAHLIGSVKADSSALGSLRKTGGNTLRYIGALMAGETPTLERAIRKFWIDKRLEDKPAEAIISTACALYRSGQVRGADEIRLNYRKFTDAWNNSSLTVHSDPDKNDEYFLKGIIRGFVMNERAIDSFELIGTQMAALGITYENLPVTKAITAETLIPEESERRQVTPAKLMEQVAEARQKALMTFVRKTYEIEYNKKQAEQDRQLGLKLTPSAALASSPLLAIEYHPKSNTID